MNNYKSKTNHPIEESPYNLHLFHKNEFLPLEGCCTKASYCVLTNLYITTYDPFFNKESDLDIYSCSKCGNMYIKAGDKFRKIENLLKYQVKLR